MSNYYCKYCGTERSSITWPKKFFLQTIIPKENIMCRMKVSKNQNIIVSFVVRSVQASVV